MSAYKINVVKEAYFFLVESKLGNFEFFYSSKLLTQKLCNLSDLLPSRVFKYFYRFLCMCP